MALAALTALMAGAAQASTIATVPLAQAGASFTFDSATGQLSGDSLGLNPGVEGIQTLLPGTTPGSTATDNTPAFFAFGPISETGPVVNGAADFSGGDFAVTTAAGSSLLTGTFGPSELLGFGTGATLLDFGNVNYTGGSDLTAFLAANGGTFATGTFTLGMTGLNPGIPPLLNAASFPDFSAQGATVTFDAQSAAVPESGTTVLLLEGLALLGLTLCIRKRLPSAA